MKAAAILIPTDLLYYPLFVVNNISLEHLRPLNETIRNLAQPQALACCRKQLAQ